MTFKCGIIPTSCFPSIDFTVVMRSCARQLKLCRKPDYLNFIWRFLQQTAATRSNRRTYSAECCWARCTTARQRPQEANLYAQQGGTTPLDYIQEKPLQYQRCLDHWKIKSTFQTRLMQIGGGKRGWTKIFEIYRGKESTLLQRRL